MPREKNEESLLEEMQLLNKRIAKLDKTDTDKELSASRGVMASDARYRNFFISSRDAIMTLEPPSWRFTTGNPATIEMFKAKNEDEFVSCEPWKLSPEHQPDGRASDEKAKEMIAKAMCEGSSFFEWTHKRISGEEFPATVLLSRIEQDESTFLLATVRDITEHKKVEEVTKAFDYVESILETMREALIVLDANLNVISANKSFYQTFKVNPNETQDKFIYDLGNRQWDIPKLRQLLENILPKNHIFEGYEIEHDFKVIGRKTMLLNARCLYRKANKTEMILLAIEDITERREIEKGLEKTRKELATTKISEDAAREYAESIINTVREPLIALDQDLRVISVNSSFYDVFKVNPRETVGQLIYDLGNKQWDIPKLRELLETILPQKTTFNNYEVEHDFITIGRRIMLLNARQIQRVLGKERVILLAIEDITERRKVEDALARQMNELQDAMGQIKTLRGLFPICMYCKKIRDDKQYWQQIEGYISKHSEARFSHGICPDCYKKHFQPELDKMKNKMPT